MTKEITEKEYLELTKNKDGKIRIIDFYATWCNPCKMLSPVLEELEEKRDDVEVYKVDVDIEGNLANELNVFSIPTVFIHKDGELKNVFKGFQPLPAIEKLIENI